MDILACLRWRVRCVLLGRQHSMLCCGPLNVSVSPIWASLHTGSCNTLAPLLNSDGPLVILIAGLTRALCEILHQRLPTCGEPPKAQNCWSRDTTARHQQP